MFERFTEEERDAMLRSFISVNPKTLLEAESVATLLADDEENPQEAILALKFFYCQPENKKMLEEMLTRLSLDEF